MTFGMSPEDIARLPYRPGVGVMLLNREHKVFVAQRIDTPFAAWQMPQGGIDKGEAPRDAAMRELEEEIGTRKAEVIGESRGWLTYDLPQDLVPRVWSGCFRGQSQKWFLLRFLGEDSDICIDTVKPEFSAWKWAAPETLADTIVPFKRQLYRDILAEFAPLLEASTKSRKL